jgi:hypothetical protein
MMICKWPTMCAMCEEPVKPGERLYLTDKEKMCWACAYNGSVANFTYARF